MEMVKNHGANRQEGHKKIRDLSVSKNEDIYN